MPYYVVLSYLWQKCSFSNKFQETYFRAKLYEQVTTDNHTFPFPFRFPFLSNFSVTHFPLLQGKVTLNSAWHRVYCNWSLRFKLTCTTIIVGTSWQMDRNADPQLKITENIEAATNSLVSEHSGPFCVYEMTHAVLRQPTSGTHTHTWRQPDKAPDADANVSTSLELSAWGVARSSPG